MDSFLRTVGVRSWLGGLAMLSTAVMAAPATAAPALLTSQHERNGTVYVRVIVPSGGVGWQSYDAYSVPAGKDLIFSYICPSDATTPVNGSFNSNSAAHAGLQLVGNYRPSNETDAWSWAFDWPKGAPSGSVINFNVYCVQ